ncbi:MAG: hypothetical protein R3337_05490 [Gammaproteobacteria bacterium]|nr:hypothetical protein [Gammaproteobacteria bacterium]
MTGPTTNFCRENPAFKSSAHVIREFCPRCGTTFTYQKVAGRAPKLEEAARVVYIAVASLDDPGAYPPDEVVHGRERIEWLHLGGEIPIHDFTSPGSGHLQFGGIEARQERAGSGNSREPSGKSGR